MNNLEKIQHYMSRQAGDMALPDGFSQEDCFMCTAQVLLLVDRHAKGQLHDINVQLKQVLRTFSENVKLED